MFLVMAALMFTGFPVAFVLGAYRSALGHWLGRSTSSTRYQFYNLLIRIWGGVAASQVLVAIPIVHLHGSSPRALAGVATGALKTHADPDSTGIPGGLAMSVTLMGTVMAATTGIVGASVVLLTLIALPP